MMISWTYEIILLTVILAVMLSVFAYWSGKVLRICGLVVGMVGIWFIIADPLLVEERSKTTAEVEDIQAFLISEQARITDTIILNGLNHQSEDLLLLDSFVIKPGNDLEVVDGFSEIKYPKRIIEGEDFEISGSLLLQDSVEANVVLRRPDGSEKDLFFNDENRFSVQERSPVPGLYEYLICVEFSEDTLTEIIPIEVLEPNYFKMLIYASSPQFELNYLKNYWVNQGHGIVQKVRISRDKYNTSAINAPKLEFTSITGKVLENFDVLLMDVASWNGLSDQERRRISQSINNEGKGLMLIPTIIDEKARDLPLAQLESFADQEIAGVNLSAAQYRASSIWQKLAQGWVMRKGLGKVMLLKWVDTYQLLLADQSVEYQSIWSEVLSEVFSELTYEFTTETRGWPIADRKVVLDLYYVNQQDMLSYDSISLKLAYTPYLQNVAQASITGESGWNKVVRLADGKKSWFYIFPSDARQTMRQMELKEDILSMSEAPRKNISGSFEQKQAIPWWIPWGLVLVGFGMVWVLEKIK